MVVLVDGARGLAYKRNKSLSIREVVELVLVGLLGHLAVCSVEWVARASDLVFLLGLAMRGQRHIKLQGLESFRNTTDSHIETFPF